MSHLIDTITIRSTSENIINQIKSYFIDSDHYKTWHEDHIYCKWLKGKTFEVGSILVACETVNKYKMRLKFKITEVSDTTLEYKVLFPYSIICPSGGFLCESENMNTKLSAYLKIRQLTLVEKIAGNTISSLRKHMEDEGLRIKESLENSVKYDGMSKPKKEN